MLATTTTQKDLPKINLNTKVASTVVLPPKDANTLDLDKLAHAVAHAESGDCTKGIGVKKNNCFGIMTYVNGKRSLKAYKSKEESYADFKRIWSKSYKKFPNIRLAEVWTGADNAKTWLANVSYHYKNL